jgi:hypothetical protein
VHYYNKARQKRGESRRTGFLGNEVAGSFDNQVYKTGESRYKKRPDRPDPMATSIVTVATRERVPRFGGSVRPEGIACKRVRRTRAALRASKGQPQPPAQTEWAVLTHLHEIMAQVLAKLYSQELHYTDPHAGAPGFLTFWRPMRVLRKREMAVSPGMPVQQAGRDKVRDRFSGEGCSGHAANQQRGRRSAYLTKGEDECGDYS